MNKEDLLTYELASELFRYEKSDGSLWWKKQRKNSRAKLNKPIGSPNKDGHLLLCMSINSKRFNFYVHRVVWLLIKGEWPSLEIDHANGIPSDNRLENLRLATRSENAMNRVFKKNGGLCKGVYRNGSKFRARAYFAGKKSVDFGTYNTYEEAREVFIKNMSVLHGEFFRIEEYRPIQGVN